MRVYIQKFLQRTGLKLQVCIPKKSCLHNGANALCDVVTAKTILLKGKKTIWCIIAIEWFFTDNSLACCTSLWIPILGTMNRQWHEIRSDAIAVAYVFAVAAAYVNNDVDVFDQQPPDHAVHSAQRKQNKKCNEVELSFEHK